MYRILAVLAFVVLSTAQHYRGNNDPRTAAILSEQRYLTGDGTFGTQYKQEDGVEFKEESDAYGNRKGSYSYVDAGGKKHTVSYTAGKDGFKASGDGIPQAPPQVAPRPQYQPQAQYNPPDQYYRQQPDYNRQQPDYNRQYQDYQPRDDYQSRSQYQSQQYQQPQYQPQSQYQPQTQYQPQQQYQPRYDPPEPTEPPHRFYPPGKLSLQRSPDGFAYSFNKS